MAEVTYEKMYIMLGYIEKLKYFFLPVFMQQLKELVSLIMWRILWVMFEIKHC